MSDRAEFLRPTALETLADVLPRFGGSIDSRGITVLPGGRVYGSGTVLTPGGRSLVSEFASDFGRAADARHWLQDYRAMRPPVRISGRTAVVAVNLGSGYAHWLLEELPRWLALRPSLADSVIANTRAPFIRDVLALIKPPQRLISVSRHSHYACETLVIPPWTQPDAETVVVLNEFARTQQLPVSAPGEMLYLSRAKAGRRRVINEDELWARLEPKGFTRICAEEFSWRDQVAMFAAARIVVAPHGAGLANVAFCRPGTRVVEFFHPDYVNRVYARLSQAAGLDYRCAMPASESVYPCDPRSGRLDIVADIAAVLAALSGD